ncbi:MAG: hypothetical protein COB02_08120 [Candidatus Cloacimonadota bacterium]|nr:MAG: hypothetical protein COB02_08120 [Candidatus Cloacimonadota bacterium]
MTKDKSKDNVINHIKEILESTPKDEHDTIFKQLLTVFFKEFIDLFLPWFSDKLDFENLEFLDKEIFLYGVSKNEKNYVDLVCKAPMLDENKESKLILIHVEIQSTKDNNMARRMFNYCCQLRLREDLDIIPIVLFADNFKWKTEVKNYYDMDYNNKKYLHFEYEQIKLLHLDAKDYLNNPNPLAQALMAKMDLSKVDQKKLKIQIARAISSGTISKSKQAFLYTFCYKYLIINNEDKQIFNDSLMGMTLEEKGKIGEIMMNFEQKIGYERGLGQGQFNFLMSLVEKGSLAVDIARKELESLKDTLPKELYEKGLKKLQ